MKFPDKNATEIRLESDITQLQISSSDKKKTTYHD